MKLISVQDISCYGQCSLTVALPILSYYGVETVILPSAILSTHTGGFKNFSVHDLTDEMPKIIAHWKSEGIRADVLYTGYIGDARQFDYILDVKNDIVNKNGLFFVDPAMADHGKMYRGLGDDIISGMRRICSVADFILPNITEACFLTDTPYREDTDEEFVNLLLDRLYGLGAKNVILTGVEREGKIGAAYFDGKSKDTVLFEKVDRSYHGTGDVFSSVVIGEICNGRSVRDALCAACLFVIDSIKHTLSDESHGYGVKFEQILHEKKF